VIGRVGAAWSLRLIGDGAAHRAGLALHLRAERELPFAGHAGLDLEAVKPELIGGQGCHLASHLGHPARPHVSLRFEQHGAGDGLAFRHVDEANRDRGFARARRLGLNQLEAVVVGRGNGIPLGRQEKTCEEGGADQGTRRMM
jgi:hypothetical protein